MTFPDLHLRIKVFACIICKFIVPNSNLFSVLKYKKYSAVDDRMNAPIFATLFEFQISGKLSYCLILIALLGSNIVARPQSFKNYIHTTVNWPIENHTKTNSWL